MSTSQQNNLYLSVRSLCQQHFEIHTAFHRAFERTRAFDVHVKHQFAFILDDAFALYASFSLPNGHRLLLCIYVVAVKTIRYKQSHLLPNPFTITQPIVIRTRPITPANESFSLYAKTETSDVTIKPTPHHVAYPMLRLIRNRLLAKV